MIHRSILLELRFLLFLLLAKETKGLLQYTPEVQSSLMSTRRLRHQPLRKQKLQNSWVGITIYLNQTQDPNETILLGPKDNLIVERLRQKLRRFFSYLAQKWWNFKKIVRYCTQKYTVYVLQCDQGKYYVGSTSHKRQRFRQHQTERGGSAWTRKYRPIKVIKQHNRIPKAYYLGKESQVTAKLMLKYGVNNVRGAMFAQPKMYTMDDIDSLVGFLGHYNDMSYREVKKILKETLPKSKLSIPKKKARNRKRKQCYKCGSFDHKAADCPLQTHQKMCYNCGKYGHIAANCPEPDSFSNNATNQSVS